MSRELLPGWDEPWVLSARTELDLLRIHALEAAGAALLLSGRVGEACEAALAAVALDPLRESATRLLIDVHLRGGNTVDALRCYQRFAALLNQEIDVRPGPAITSVIAAHLGGSSAAALLQAQNQQRGGSRGAPSNITVPTRRREGNDLAAGRTTR
jgi:DNA-binding SARP family transcriptional activator